MELCHGHQLKLREELNARGLGAYIADDMEEVGRRMSRTSQEGKQSLDTFCPLYQGSFNLLNNCARVASINGDLNLHLVLGCSLCHVMSRYPRASDYAAWIPAAAEGMLKLHNGLANEAR